MSQKSLIANRAEVTRGVIRAARGRSWRTFSLCTRRSTPASRTSRWLTGGIGAATTHRLVERAFGDGAYLVRPLVRRARYIEMKDFGFGDGRAFHLLDRDGSLQRSHQRVIEDLNADERSTGTTARH